MTDGVNPYYAAFNFSMNDMPGYTELTNLFDFYKLTGVTFHVIPYKQTDSNSVGSTNNTYQVPIFYAIDRSDSTTLHRWAIFLNTTTTRLPQCGKALNYTSQPQIRRRYSGEQRQVGRTSNPSLNWYGLKIAIPPTNVATTFYVLFTYYVKCKDPK